jgi:hypothetical protein
MRWENELLKGSSCADNAPSVWWVLMEDADREIGRLEDRISELEEVV